MPPRFFVDRNLGTKIVPGALRAAGWDVLTLADVFGEQPGQAVRDEDWLAYAGEHGLAALIKDKRIRYRSPERAALIGHGVTAFCLANGQLDGQAQADLFLKHQSRIMRLAEGGGGAIFVVSQSTVRPTTLD